MTAHVKPGVFFDQPDALPRGPHQLPREQVQNAQRQRLMMAFTELLADRGYPGVRIIDIAKRAGVSNDAFYDVFTNKEACACAAHDRFVEVLGSAAYGAVVGESKTWREFVQASVSGYLHALEADPVVARAFQLEMDGIGVTARQRRRNALVAFAEVRLRAQEQLRKTDPLLKQHPLIVHLGSVYAVRQLACDALEAEREPDFAKLVPDLVNWIVAAWYGDGSDGDGQ
jgi:AcrR family transcriptional regulator